MIRKTTHLDSVDSLDEWIDRVCEADPLPELPQEPEPENGPPLSREEVEAARTKLSLWQQPPAFIRTTEELCRRCTSEDWFNRPHLKFLHDAYVLAEFVRLTLVDQVRLATASEQWPDGQVRAGDKTHNIEVTSTHGGRRLGEEYRGVQAATLDPVKNWIARAESIPHHLNEAINAKAEKNYGSACWLVVYLNINEYDIRQAEIERVIATIKARYAAAFEAISVLWKQKLY